MPTPDSVPIAFSGLEPSKFESFPQLTTITNNSGTVPELFQQHW